MFLMERRKEFDHVAQRVVHVLLVSFSDFTPFESNRATENSQKEFHGILKSILENLYEASDLDLPMVTDEAYEWWQCNNTKAELNKIYQTIFKNISDYYRLIYLAGLKGEISNETLTIDLDSLKDHKTKPKVCHLNVLKKVGIESELSGKKLVLTYPANSEILSAWKLLSEVCDDFLRSENHNRYDVSLFHFACGMYCNDERYWLRNIEKICGLEEGLLFAAEEKYLQKGYVKSVAGTMNNNEITLRYSFMNDISGFSISYQPRKAEQVFFSVQNTVGMKAMLEDFKQLPESIQTYFVNACRRCNDCMGCTKGGKSKAFTVRANYGGEELKLCPQFPMAHWFEWSAKRTEDIMLLNDLQTQYAR
ncbi:MAG: hypothetical protein K0S47_3500 [Herbinix sp.]|jgi:hypothetical protein|nr:hypothetical protein [Herbinix sp.]